MTTPRVTVYVLHWRAPDQLVRAVRSLRESTGVDLEIVVVDNASGDDALAQIRAELPGAQVLHTGGNLGYAGAANVALDHQRSRTADVVVLAAHDVLVDPHTLALLAAALDASPEHAIVGPSLWDPAFERPESVGGSYHVWSGGPLIPAGSARAPDHNGIVDAAFVSGALMAIRTGLLDGLGGLDARLFAYWEDVELCLRAQRLGHRVGVVVRARAAETGYSTAHQTHAFLIARNHLLVTRRHRGRAALTIAGAGVAIRAARAAAGSAIPTRPREQRATSWAFAVGRWRGLWAGLGNRGGPPPAALPVRRPDLRARFSDPPLMTGTMDTPPRKPAIDTKAPARSAAGRLSWSRVLRKAYPWFERLGLHVTPVHFYQPVPDTRTLGVDTWERRSELVGIDLRVTEQLEMLEEIGRAIGTTIEPLPRTATGAAHRFHLDNHTFGEVDAEVLSFLIHRHRPRRILEIGSGYSTMLAAQTLLDVAAMHDEPPGELIAIEPYPSPTLERGFPGLTRLVRSTNLHEVGPELASTLGEGDILFIDSTHVLHIASDVRVELLELVPRLAPGVLIHVHDIFFPMEYPQRWIRDNRWFWTEQYALQAFLAGNSSFEVVWASHLMHVDHPEPLARAIPSYDPQRSAPGSFWFRRVR